MRLFILIPLINFRSDQKLFRLGSAEYQTTTSNVFFPTRIVMRGDFYSEQRFSSYLTVAMVVVVVVVGVGWSPSTVFASSGKTVFRSTAVFAHLFIHPFHAIHENCRPR